MIVMTNIDLVKTHHEMKDWVPVIKLTMRLIMMVNVNIDRLPVIKLTMRPTMVNVNIDRVPVIKLTMRPIMMQAATATQENHKYDTVYS